MVNAEFLAKAKKNLCLVNASRGGLVDEAALLEFLNSNPAASAYLDTFEEEPYTGPLSKMKNCTLTPHIGSYASEVRINMEMEAAQNVINLLQKEMSKVLVTGGSGFLGSHIADALSDIGHEVTILDQVESPYLREDQSFIKGDVCDAEKLVEQLSGFDYVYHLAALADLNAAKASTH